jgi:hypothetical protein
MTASSASLSFSGLNRAVEAAGLDEGPIVAVFGLANAARAHERLAAGHVLGIVLRMDGASGVQEIVGPFAQQAGLRVPSPLRTPRSLRPGRTGRPS